MRVFPGGELAHLSSVIGEAERVGFRILEVQSLREYYARTCRTWVERLGRNRDACVALVGEQKYRTWLLYLAASAFSFEQCQTDAFSILMKKRKGSAVYHCE
jgi:cyclopropane-fatty-acyl-phospholipid synthase